MFDAVVYQARRKELAARIGKDAVLIVASRPEQVRNADAHFVFRQHSDVLYLTGFAEPETVVVFRPGAAEQLTMFVRPRDPEQEVWDGRRAGIEGAKTTFAADAAYPIAEFSTRLAGLLANHEELHYSVGVDEQLDAIVCKTVASLRNREKRGQRPPRAIVDLRSSLHEQRLFKGKEELSSLRIAARISSEAHLAAMRLGKPGSSEQEIDAVLSYTFRSRGGTGPGYNPIVGTGVNATILHYIENNCAIADGDLVLVDAGCEFEGYTADITRTWPASGKFSAPQRKAYELVLAVQKQAIAMVAPGETIENIHNVCIRGLTAAMIELGLLTGTVEERIADSSYRKYYMHGTSHWLGMDVHDVGAYTVAGKARPLAPGMVITVEPGLYVAANDDTQPELRGLGIRIEDDILVTDNGHENLTAACPKEVLELEHACSRS